MMTAPLYMTEKVGMLTLSRFSAGTDGKTAGASAVGQQPHAGASADTRALIPVNLADSRLHASPPSLAHLISYIKILGGKRVTLKPPVENGLWMFDSRLTPVNGLLFSCLLFCYFPPYVSYYVLTSAAVVGYFKTSLSFRYICSN